ncbi:MAG: M4 family metallopeptidase [Gammaproteobacteria bacterium]
MKGNKIRFLSLVCLSAISTHSTYAVNVEYLWNKTNEVPKLNQVYVVNNKVSLKEPISSKAQLFSLKNSSKPGLYEYRLRNGFIDSEGVTHSRYDEYYKNIPVLWADTIVHNKKYQSINGTFVTEIEKDVPSIKPKLSKEQALAIAKNNFMQNIAPKSKATSKLEVSELVIYPYAKDKMGNSVARLAYQVSYYTTAPNNKFANPNYIIDANSGAILNYFDNLKRVQAQVGTGPGGNTNPVLTNGSYNYGIGAAPLLGYLLIQTDTPAVGQCTWGNRGVAAVSLGNATNIPSIFPVLQNDEINYPVVVIPSCSAGTNYANLNDNGEAPINGGISPDNDILYYGTQTYNMFAVASGNSAPFGPNSPAIRYYVHINSTDAFAQSAGCGSTPDACYNQQAAFGNGQTQFYPQVGYDVVGHETAHIYIGRTSGLVYANQSGGMNEAFADITGASLGAYIGSTFTFFPPTSSRVSPSFWTQGALDSRTTPALRYLFNPPLDGNSIDNAANYRAGMDVHYSSGVYNKAFYNMSVLFGNTYPAVLRAFKYMVTANDRCWTSNMDFFQGSCCVMLAAKNNHQDLANIKAAFSAVGVHCMRSLDAIAATE